MLSILNMQPEEAMVIVTALYVVVTIGICILNGMTLIQSKKQFTRTIELQKQHNYDSVRPAVTIDFDSQHTDDTFGGSITVKNHGLGPAVIKELHFTRNGEEYKNKNGYCTIYDMVRFRVLEENANMNVEELINHFYTKEFRNLINDKDYLAVDEKLLLLSFDTSDKNEAEFAGKIFDNVNMELVYTDIYGYCEWRVSKSLNYFKPIWFWN